MCGALAVYGFLNAKLRTRIGLSPPPEFLDSLIRAKTLGEALVLLRGGPYAAIESAFAETGELRSGEALLFASEISLHTELLRHAKEPVLGFIAALSLQFEVENLKRAIRLWFDRVVLDRDSRGSSEYLYRAQIVHRLELDALLAAPDYPGLAASLQGSPYADIIGAEAERFAAERKLFSLELALDRFYFGRLALAVAALEPRDRALAERMLGVEADMRNLAWIARFRSFHDKGSGAFPGSLMPGGRAVNSESLTAAWDSGSFSELFGSLGGARYARLQALFAKGSDARSRLVLLEQALRHIVREEAERLLRGHPFTIGILLAYLVRKREETRTILAILNAKRYGLDEERTRESL